MKKPSKESLLKFFDDFYKPLLVGALLLIACAGFMIAYMIDGIYLNANFDTHGIESELSTISTQIRYK